MRLTAQQLEGAAARILAAAGASEGDARQVAIRLVNGNLVGHDSHGVIRLCQYAEQLRDGSIRSGGELTQVADFGAVSVFDANLGFGQVMAEAATRKGIEKAKTYGSATIGLRNVAHVGRLGDWAELAAEAGLVSFHFVNSPAKPAVSPFGGVERRMSTNPICVGIPVEGRAPVIVDMTTSSVAEGKLRVANMAGRSIPEGWILDKEGKPSQKPGDYYDGGAMLTMGAHKGYGLSLVVDLMAGALTGGGTTSPTESVNRNNMLSFFIDPAACHAGGEANGIAAGYIDWVKASAARDPAAPVLIPGEPENLERAKRSKNGIEVPDGIWRQILDTAEGLGLSEAALLD